MPGAVDLVPRAGSLDGRLRWGGESTSLQRLYLHDNSIETLPANVFAGLTGMASLDLSCNSLTALDLSRFDPFATTLTYLDISGNSFTMEPTDAAVRVKLTNTGLILYTGTNTDCHLPTDIGLSALTTSEGELDPPFEPPGSTGGYGLHVDHDVTSITVSPTPNDPEASIRPDSDADPNTAGIQFNLSGAQNRVEWYVDAKNGLFAQMYLIDVYRAHPPGRYALLRSLTLSGATLEDFDSRAYTYTASVPTTVTVTTTPFDPDATTVVKLNGVTDSDGTVSLAVGDNVITVEVAAEDGITTETYTVTVKRAAPSAPAPATTAPDTALPTTPAAGPPAANRWTGLVVLVVVNVQLLDVDDINTHPAAYLRVLIMYYRICLISGEC